MSTTKTQLAVSHVNAFIATPTTIPLNSEPGLGYRIGLSDRVVGSLSNAPNGFLVLNQTNGNVFQSLVIASTTLSGDVAVLDTSIALTSGTEFPKSNFYVDCGGETVHVISRSTNTLTVSPVQIAHLSGVTVTLTIWITYGAVGGFDAIDPTLIPAWLAKTTTATVGYRIGTSSKTLGDATTLPEGFLILNTTDNTVYKVSGGVWIDGGSFPSDLLAAWEAA